MTREELIKYENWKCQNWFLYRESSKMIEAFLEDQLETKTLNKFDVIQRSKQVCFCGAEQRITFGDNRSYRICTNGHEE